MKPKYCVESTEKACWYPNFQGWNLLVVHWLSLFQDHSLTMTQQKLDNLVHYYTYDIHNSCAKQIRQGLAGGGGGDVGGGIWLLQADCTLHYQGLQNKLAIKIQLNCRKCAVMQVIQLCFLLFIYLFKMHSCRNILNNRWAAKVQWLSYTMLKMHPVRPQHYVL